jgi:signal transduction histidine kinase
MREISNDLLPNTLTRKGLIAAIKEAIGNMDKAGNLRIVFTHETLPDIRESAAINLYRIILEIIHNTVKHAHASELKIEIKSANGVLVILTRDDGKGFDYNNAAGEHSGLGLRNMLSRAEILGGEMFIESKSGKGTSYIFEIPLKPNQPL